MGITKENTVVEKELRKLMEVTLTLEAELDLAVQNIE